MNTQVIFFDVPTAQAKLERIVGIVNAHFQRLERLLILVPNQEAAQYIESLLWKTPEESFIPHQIVETPCQIPVAITQLSQNLNQAVVLLNLLPELPAHWREFAVVYELIDRTHPQKLQLSQNRLQSYKDFGALVTIEPATSRT